LRTRLGFVFRLLASWVELRTGLPSSSYDHLVTVDGDEATIDTQFITFDVAGTRKPEGGWPVGTFGAQGTIKPIESGYYRFAFRRTDGAWHIRHLDITHDVPYVF
jgi:hypothetical protein